MKVIIKLAILFVFVFLSTNLSFANVYNYPAKLSVISGQIPKMESISCKFKQEKRLANVSRPLISGGDFNFVEDKGVFFNTTYPIKSKSDYTSKDYKQVNDVVKAIANKKYSKLERDFDFYFQKTSKIWTLGLRPKSSSNLKNYLSSITITGENYITEIIISLNNGNKTTLWFTK